MLYVVPAALGRFLGFHDHSTMPKAGAGSDWNLEFITCKI